jgi:hypothetical protein
MTGRRRRFTGHALAPVSLISQVPRNTPRHGDGLPPATSTCGPADQRSAQAPHVQVMAAAGRRPWGGHRPSARIVVLVTILRRRASVALGHFTSPARSEEIEHRCMFLRPGQTHPITERIHGYVNLTGEPNPPAGSGGSFTAITLCTFVVFLVISDTCRAGGHR